MKKDKWVVYLSGEIHSDWRDQIRKGTEDLGLNIEFLSPVTDHKSSDDCGVSILGEELEAFWHDHKGAKLNSIITNTLLKESDIVVIRFGEKYRQWNAAFDAGYASALGKSIITVHDASLNHALKEIDAAAKAVAETPLQVVGLLKYITQGKLPE
tara:strand:- start:5912 stop:6376 length:465 start_codon:yes stop_codon:yes gene_type:complete